LGCVLPTTVAYSTGFQIENAQGILGSFLIKLNIAAAVYRRNSILHEWPILEVTGVAAITAAVSYLVSATQLVFFGVPEADISVGCLP
jgi:surface polysaccharide O-acyltransferase-like enzyme